MPAISTSARCGRRSPGACAIPRRERRPRSERGRARKSGGSCARSIGPRSRQPASRRSRSAAVPLGGLHGAMKIRYGLISCDSHAQLDRDAFVRRMPATKWGDRIPRVVELEVDGQRVDGWSVNGQRPRGGGVANCPALMPDRRFQPKRWEDVPPKAYDPIERAKALDEDRVDAEVLFPNNPVGNFSFAFDDADYELACVEAYNDALGEWTQVSDRYIPLALIPYLSPIDEVLRQLDLAAKKGHRGIVMPAEPALCINGARSLNDPYWEPLWAACQDAGLVINWHGSAGLGGLLSVPHWSGYTTRQAHTVSTGRLAATACQQLPNLMFSGILDRYPRLKWAFAETGSGWMCYVLDACDHEWERRHLWTEGVLTRPSEAFRRQVYVDFWFERSGVELRHYIGIDNLMFETDYPHITSSYPTSWEHVERTVGDVPPDERTKLLYRNALDLYGLVEDAPSPRSREAIAPSETR
ncbi:MAG: amidohydrolase family protein [Chloroflexi bacterium]|nr:amidohydrolase family protein [Chloroflexota bacterium]